MSYLNFNLYGDSPSGKTLIWEVTNQGNARIGIVKWYAPWRKYCYFPGDDTLYDKECLAEISAFLDKVNREHKS